MVAIGGHLKVGIRSGEDTALFSSGGRQAQQKPAKRHGPLEGLITAFQPAPEYGLLLLVDQPEPALH